MLPSLSGILAEEKNTTILTNNHPDSPSPQFHPDSPHSYPRSPHSHILIPSIPTLIFCVPTLIPRVPIIPLIFFADSPFQLLQVALILKAVIKAIARTLLGHY